MRYYFLILLYASNAACSFIPESYAELFKPSINYNNAFNYFLCSIASINNWCKNTIKFQHAQWAPKKYSSLFNNKTTNYSDILSNLQVQSRKRNITSNLNFVFNAQKIFHTALACEAQQITFEACKKIANNYQAISAENTAFGLLKAPSKEIQQYVHEAQAIPLLEETTPSFDCSEKLADVRRYLLQCKECFDPIERQSIRNDHFYRGARGSLVGTLRSHIKKVKSDLNIEDNKLKDSYSSNLGGGGYYITVGKDSNNFFRGTSNETDEDLKTIYNASLHGTLHEYSDVIERLEGGYKIHIQPKSLEQYLNIIEELLKLAQGTKEFQESLRFFKVYTDVNFNKAPLEMDQHLQEHSYDGVVPLIVLYPAAGQENAQKVLDIVYKKFGALEGLNCPPAFNEKVTSLIYIAQGNRNQKNDEGYAEYFSANRVYYGEKLNNRPSHVYRLKNPVLEAMLDSYINAVKNKSENIETIIKNLADMNFTIHCADRRGYTLLDYAFLFNNEDVIKDLLDVGARVVAMCPINVIKEKKNNFLQHVLSEYNIAKKSNARWMESVDEERNSLLYYALKEGNREAVGCLVRDHSIKIDSLNNSYKTPLSQFIEDVNKGKIVLSQAHVEAFEELLGLKPELSTKVPKLEGIDSNSFKSELLKKTEQYKASLGWVMVL